jgi:hypothetical protein
MPSAIARRNRAYIWGWVRVIGSPGTAGAYDFLAGFCFEALALLRVLDRLRGLRRFFKELVALAPPTQQPIPVSTVIQPSSLI